MPSQNTPGNSFTATLKSAGSWFFFGNAALNGQAHPAISFVYAALFATQRTASHVLGDKTSGRLVNFIMGPQGPLFVNAVATAGAGAAATLFGPPELATACFDFSIANLFQSLVFGEAIKFNTTRLGQIGKSASLAACELFILHALVKVAENAGFSSKAAYMLAAPGMVCAGLRSFAPKWLPSGLAYADMMAIAVATGVKAAATGNYLNALSRGLAFVAFSRLAVSRAQTDGKTSVFEVERWVPRLLRRNQPATAAPN